MITAFHIAALILYFSMIAAVSLASWRKSLTSADFILGSRKLNFWLTALAAHASDMSSWIFMGYPVVIYTTGLLQGWAAIGLVLFMYFNWTFIAPKLRRATEGYNSLTISSFLESRLNDTSGALRLISALLSFLFYSVYISAGLVGLGLLLSTLFDISYASSVLIGLCIVVPYLFIAGYITLAWTDLVQGTFLLCVILAVPLWMIYDLGGISRLLTALDSANLRAPFMPSLQGSSLWLIFCTASAWGLGYFGQPHILTKFMGIADPSQMPKSRAVGLCWQSFALLGSTLLGLIFFITYPTTPDDPQTMFIRLVIDHFPPFLAMLILCALLGVTITSMGSYLLVATSHITEDFYKKILRKKADSRELLIVSRAGILAVAIVSALIALAKPASIFTLVEYAWFGLGSTFGPVILYTLYSRHLSKEGAWAGIVFGGFTAALWPFIPMDHPIPTLIPAFSVSLFAIFLFSRRKKASAN